MFPV